MSGGDLRKPLRSTKATAGRLVVGGLIGLSVAFCLGSLFVGWTETSWETMWLVTGLLTVVFWFIVDRWLLGATWARLGGQSSNAKTFWILGSLAVSALLLLVVPLRHPVFPEFPVKHVVEIRATRDKNPESVASEVRLLEVGPIQSVKVDPQDCQISGDWQVADGVWDSSSDEVRSLGAAPAWVRCEITTTDNAYLRFIAHDWSGVAVVVWDGHEERLDLYSETMTDKIVNLPHIPAGTLPPVGLLLFHFVHWLAACVSMGAAVLTAGIWLVTTRRAYPGSHIVPRWEWMVYALICVVVWGVWLLAFWPGVMDADSLGQWNQILTGKYDDWHPAILTFFMWVVTRAWFSPAAVVVIQIVGLSLVTGWGIGRFRHWGLPRWTAVLLCLVFALIPFNATSAISILKDTAYAIALLAMTLLILELVVSDGTWLRRGSIWLTLGGAAAGVALFRHNGWPLAFGVLILLIAAFREYWRQLTLALLMALVVWAGIRGPLYRAFDVRYTPSMLNWPFVDRRPLPSKHLVQAWTRASYGWPYGCFDLKKAPPDQIADTTQASTDAIGQQSMLDSLECLSHVNVGDLLEKQTFIWRISRPPGGHYEALRFWVANETQVRTMDPRYDLGLTSDSAMPELQLVLANWCMRTAYGNRHLASLFWRPALYLYLGLAGAAVASLRARNWKYLLVMAPVGGQSLLMLAFAPAELMRLQLPVMQVGLLIGGFLLMITPRSDESG